MGFSAGIQDEHEGNIMDLNGFNLKIMRISWAYHGNINENDTTNC